MAKTTVAFIKEKTWDVITDKRIQTLHPAIRNKAKEFVLRAEKELGIKLRVTSALRTFDEQAKLYEQGRRAKGKIVTNAKAGESMHNYGLAIDVVEMKDGKPLWNNPNWQVIANLGKSIGFSWGGDWRTLKDKPHFEMTFGYNKNELLTKYHLGERDGNYVHLA